MEPPATVLVVEDEPAIAAAVAARLQAEGFAVHVAVDGPAGVAAAAELAPDLVVLDVMLPGFDGLEVCRRVQAQRPVPVLMLTAREDEADTLMGLAAGADDYLTKPFSMRELVARVHALLRRVRRAAELAREGEAAPLQVLGDLEIDRSRAAGPPQRHRRPPHADWSSTCCPAWPSDPQQVLTPGAAARPGMGLGRRLAAPAPSTATSRRCGASSAPDVIRTVHGVGYAVGD